MNSKPFAVITGASSGIGYELAKQFAQNGFDILIAADSDKINQVVPSLEVIGANVQAVQTDLATPAGVDQLYQVIKATGRPVEAICLNAGVGVGGDFTKSTQWADELNMINLNVVNTTYLAKKILPDLVAQGRGRVLFTASQVSTMPGPFEAVYGATKAFVFSLSEALRNEVKDTGVTITALRPGATNTNFFHRAGLDDTKVGSEGKFENDPADVAKQGFDALMAGKDEVVAASLKTKLQTAANELMPEPMKAEMHRKLSEPGSAKKSA